MHFGRLRLPGLLVLLLLATAACSSAEARPRPVPADVAVRSYAPPAGAPSFCAVLAGTTDLSGVSGAMGVLAAFPDDVEAQLALGKAVGELRELLDELRSAGDHREVEATARRLVTALQQAKDAPATDAVRAAVITGLDDLGARVQPVCGFPE